MTARAAVNRSVLELARGDITKETVDAIANAANSRLAGGGGVDGAIHRAGGPAIMADLERYRRAGGCPTGKAVLTIAGNLKAKGVLHAVGPVWRGGGHGEPDSLASAYRECLRIANEQGFQSIAFPSISTGVYGYPLEQAAPVAIREVVAHLNGKTSLERVRFVLFDDRTFEAYRAALDALAPGGRA